MSEVLPMRGQHPGRILFCAMAWLAGFAAGTPMTVSGADEPDLLVQSSVKDVVTGSTSWTQVGDELEYTLQYDNVGNATGSNAVIHEIIPQGTVYIPGSIKLPEGATVTFYPSEANAASFDVTLGDLDAPASYVAERLGNTKLYNNVQLLATLTSGTNGCPVFAANDSFGRSVCQIGDIDGDGQPYIVVGAPGDSSSGTNAGAAYLLRLNSDGTVKSYVKWASGLNGAPVLAPGDSYGFSVASVGDLDGDGIPDVVVGAANDSTGGPQRGAVYVQFLNADGTIRSYVKLASGTNGCPVLQNNALFGYSVSQFVDLNGNGVPELLVGAPLYNAPGYADSGAVYLLYMNQDGTVISNTVIGAGMGSEVGCSITLIDDFNGNGVPKLLVGQLPNGNSGGLWEMPINTNGAVLSGVNRLIPDWLRCPPILPGHTHDFYAYGFAVANLGDLNADGISDVAVGLPYASFLQPDQGAVQLLYLDRAGGGDYGTTVTSGSTPGLNLPPNSLFGASVALLNGADQNTPTRILVGAPGQSGTNGAVYVLALSPASETNLNTIDHNGFKYWPATFPTNTVENGALGLTRFVTNVLVGQQGLTNVTGNNGPTNAWAWNVNLAGVGDVNGDGVADAALCDMMGTTSSVYVVFMDTNGAPASAVLLPPGTNGIPSLAQYGTVFGNGSFGYSLAGIGDLDGDGVPDLVVGAPYSGANGFQYGAVYVIFLNRDGSVKSSVQLSSGTNGCPVIPVYSRFGLGVCSLGDVNGDGVPDIAVAASDTVYILCLNRDGTVKFSTSFPVTSLTGGLENIVCVGDIDGNGVPDLLVGAPAEYNNGVVQNGAVCVLLLETNLTLKSQVVIYDGTNGCPPMYATTQAFFGSGLAPVGDMNGDGIPDVLVSARGYGGTYGGTLFLLYLNRDGTVKGYEEIDPSTDPALVGQTTWLGASLANLGPSALDGQTRLLVANGWGFESSSSVMTLWLTNKYCLGPATYSVLVTQPAQGLLGWDKLSVSQAVPAGTSAAWSIYSSYNGNSGTLVWGPTNMASGTADISMLPTNLSSFVLAAQLGSDSPYYSPSFDSWKMSYVASSPPQITFQVQVQSTQGAQPTVDNVATIATSTPESSHANNSSTNSIGVRVIQLIWPEWQTNGGIQFVLSGFPGSSYAIEASTNLAAWEAISTNVMPAGGTLTVADPVSTNFHSHFYRARQLSQ
jgi:uncharacterized repeat protein (TIGR01451 family)